MYYQVIKANSSNDHEADNFAEKEIGEEIFTQEENITQWQKEVFPCDY